VVTGWSLRRIARACVSAGPPLRLLALGVLLFGVVLTHGASPESGGGHLMTSAAVPATASLDDAHGASGNAHGAAGAQAVAGPVALGDHQGGDDPTHTGEQCAAGQPQQGPALAAPCLAASVSERATSRRALSKRGLIEPELPDSSSAAHRAYVVQQV
jgi:hypothetical protein